MKHNQVSQQDFEIVKELGSGSFGTVHLARKIDEDKLYAIKSVQLSQMSQKQKDSALNEVRLLASINIPYVVAYNGAYFNVAKQSLCIVMEYADGGDLQNKITDLKDTTEKGFDETFVWKVAYELFMGLKILHKNKIIHRDIKSANIFFSKGIAKLGDLNVSKFAEQGMCETQTGTPYYTSPEIWKGEKYGSKCDIWSTGCLLYEMCTLTHPFKARDFPSLYRKVIVGDYQPIPSSYSHELKEIIRMCLTVDDEMRPSASEILETSIMTGIDANMEKFDNKGQIHLIDAIKCPRVLRFLNTKLPKPLQKEDSNKKTVIFSTKKQIEKTEGHGFKIHKQANIRRIRSEKVIAFDSEQSDNFKKPSISKISSKKNIKLPPLDQSTQAPLNFSNKKVKHNASIKRIPSNKHIAFDSSKNPSREFISNSSIEKNDSVLKAAGGSKVNIGISAKKIGSSRQLISSKKIPSHKHIVFAEKENKKLVL